MIRRARQDDLSQIQSIARDAYGIYVPRMDKTPGPMTWDYAEHIANDLTWVYENSGHVFGFVVLLMQNKPPLLDTVAVDPAYQGQGIGRKLITKVEDWLSANGFKQVTLYTNVAMTENRLWYPKLGYRETSVVTEHGYERVYFLKDLQVRPC